MLDHSETELQDTLTADEIDELLSALQTEHDEYAGIADLSDNYKLSDKLSRMKEKIEGQKHTETKRYATPEDFMDIAEIYRVYLLGKLVELSGEIFDVQIRREHWDVMFLCEARVDNACRMSASFAIFQLNLAHAGHQAEMIWSAIQFDRFDDNAPVTWSHDGSNS